MVNETLLHTLVPGCVFFRLCYFCPLSWFSSQLDVRRCVISWCHRKQGKTTWFRQEQEMGDGGLKVPL